MAAAFKKMMEDGIGDELPEMPEDGEVCDVSESNVKLWAPVKSSWCSVVKRLHDHSAARPWQDHRCVSHAAPEAVAAGSGAGDGNGQLAPQRSVVIRGNRIH
jgi:hypothetical protein